MSSLTLKSQPIVDRRSHVIGAQFVGTCPHCGFETRPLPAAGLVHGTEHTCTAAAS